MAIVINGKEKEMKELGLREIFAFSRILNKMDMKEEFKSLAVRGAELSKIEGDSTAAATELGVEVMYAIITKLGNAEDEFFDFLAKLYGVSVPEFEYHFGSQIEELVQDFINNKGKDNFLNSAKKLFNLTK
ncbi:hypothetical protein P4U05_16905 [Bacillus paranthracis]|uniref:hypothetical protein n=1 Tax=Bacillus phage phi4B1 TaxID=1643324 RepID=UPI000200F430|nr:hypothetical protein [Bacillus paranthracis]YP_009206316.1 hypothetical protein XO26_0017 [Bacillus phage phi4B1]ADY20368.1 hypothetical protein YBT020_05610 [Bacillus thuringiensis serovar finitimus YBT-020]MEB9692466.1 hypothetical protein [Bacillus cereus]MED3289247.1 hypothetical protein [Bacillus thuringiensis]OTX71310.1 hypothetical protein BK722_12920 [Bacillus thuringiensis serovar finitimus]PGZ45692.1 hypothetical protein COE56_25770 [Bacillus anthracis]